MTTTRKDDGQWPEPPLAKARRISTALRLMVWGFIALGVVFLAPDAGSAQGLSFFQVARASSWRNPGDWPAGWYSVKLILLCIGIILILEGLSILAAMLKRETLVFALILTCLVPALGLLDGIYCLVKALL